MSSLRFTSYERNLLKRERAIRVLYLLCLGVGLLLFIGTITSFFYPSRAASNLDPDFKLTITILFFSLASKFRAQI